MKRKHNSKILALLILTFLWASCSKSNETFLPDNTQNLTDSTWSYQELTQTRVDPFLDSLLPAPQYDSIVNGVTTVRYFPSLNIKLTIPAFTFIDSLQPNSANTNLLLKITVLRKKGDWLKSRIPSKTTDSINLNTLSYVFVSASLNGNELNLLPGTSITIESSETVFAQQTLALFSGAASTLSGLYNGWSLNNASSATLIGGTANPSYRYSINKTGWSSLQVPLDTTGYNVKVLLALPLKFTNLNTQAFVVLNSSRTVIKMKDIPAGKYFQLSKMPSNGSAMLVTISKFTNGEYYLGQYPFTITRNRVIQFSPSVSSPAEIASFLSAL